jgi:hypothetical protein
MHQHRTAYVGGCNYLKKMGSEIALGSCPVSSFWGLYTLDDGMYSSNQDCATHSEVVCCAVPLRRLAWYKTLFLSQLNGVRLN